MDPATTSALTPFLIAAVAALVGWFGLRAHGARVRGRLEAAVSSHGLTVTAASFGLAARAQGQVDGLRVEILYSEPADRSGRKQLIEPQGLARVEIGLPTRMPLGLRVLSMGLAQGMVVALGGQDIELGDEYLDPLVRVRGDEVEGCRSLLSTAAVRNALTPCAGNPRASLDLDGTRLSYRETGPVGLLDPGRTLELALRLGRSLVEAAEAPWTGLARSRGLQLAHSRDGEGRTLSGRVGEVDVKVVLGADPHDPDAPQTRVTASISPPLPGGLRLRGRARGVPRAGISTGDPVLDGVVDVVTSDPDLARAVLAQGELTGPVLELLHGHPGSTVHPRGVVLVAAGWRRDDLEALLDATVELATLLGEASRAVSADLSR